MSFKKAFLSLKEVFPQVDVRILKAVAIEHYKDPDEAVEFILTEVLPSLSGPLEPHYILDNCDGTTDTLLQANSSEHGSSSRGIDEEAHTDTDLSVGEGTIASQNKSNCYPLVEYVVESNKQSFQLMHQEQLVEQAQETSATSEHSSMECREPSHCSDGELFYGDSVLCKEQEARVSNYLFGSQSNDEDTIKGMSSMIPSDKQTFYESEPNFAVSSICTTVTSQSSSLRVNANSVVHGKSVEKNVNMYGNECEEQSQCFLENDGEDVASSKDMVTVNHKHCHSTVATQSGQILNIDLLEDFINDAKNNKALLTAMDSIVRLVKEAELQERAALRAKDEASDAGLDVLAKVEELKRMLLHAKEANEMHAGEVYGEKSILATEARELQSRLLLLADDRDRSLSIIEEMRKTLEARLAAAETERATAEKEKLDKEENARKALSEQEIIMDEVVNESKKLQQEAEENSKLREFLVDRGRIVDMLQGEMAVICEDVMSLKETVDGGLSFSKFLQSSLTSLASSSKSHKSTTEDIIAQPMVLPGSSKIISQEHKESQRLESCKESSGSSVAAAGDSHKAFSDEEWDLFDDA